MAKMVQAGQKHKLLWSPLLLLVVVTAGLISCNGDGGKKGDDNPPPPPVQTVKAPSFNADSAFAFVKQQVDFGPRVPNSNAHTKCADWMANVMGGFADTVIVQRYNVTAFDGKVLNSKNIIASFRPDLGNRILLCAHWDTRPFADKDSERKNEPIDGANDGASGVGVLMEVARQLSIAKPNLGVDIISDSPMIVSFHRWKIRIVSVHSIGQRISIHRITSHVMASYSIW
jgi:glutaminyl-peptide cyclotransferase